MADSKEAQFPAGHHRTPGRPRLAGRHPPNSVPRLTTTPSYRRCIPRDGAGHFKVGAWPQRYAARWPGEAMTGSNSAIYPLPTGQASLQVRAGARTPSAEACSN